MGLLCYFFAHIWKCMRFVGEANIFTSLVRFIFLQVIKQKLFLLPPPHLTKSVKSRNVSRWVQCNVVGGVVLLRVIELCAVILAEVSMPHTEFYGVNSTESMQTCVNCDLVRWHFSRSRMEFGSEYVFYYESSEDETVPEETFRRKMKKQRFVCFFLTQKDRRIY